MLNFCMPFIPIEKCFKILVLFGDLGWHFSTLLSLFLNMFFCIDLIITLWSPFSVARLRIKFYDAISAVLSLILVIIIYAFQDY